MIKIATLIINKGMEPGYELVVQQSSLYFTTNTLYPIGHQAMRFIVTLHIKNQIYS